MGWVMGKTFASPHNSLGPPTGPGGDGTSDPMQGDPSTTRRFQTHRGSWPASSPPSSLPCCCPSLQPLQGPQTGVCSCLGAFALAAVLPWNTVCSRCSRDCPCHSGLRSELLPLREALSPSPLAPASSCFLPLRALTSLFRFLVLIYLPFSYLPLHWNLNSLRGGPVYLSFHCLLRPRAVQGLRLLGVLWSSPQPGGPPWNEGLGVCALSGLFALGTGLLRRQLCGSENISDSRNTFTCAASLVPRFTMTCETGRATSEALFCR